MRKTVISVLLALGIFLLLTVFAGFYFVLKRPQPRLRTAEVKVGENVFAVEVASTSISRARGLSGREGLGENEGMFFVFDEPEAYGFWMKDMRFPIDIIWIAGDSVASFTENAAPEPGVPLWKLKIYYPPEPVNRVLEIRAGMVQKRGIKIGDKIILALP